MNGLTERQTKGIVLGIVAAALLLAGIVYIDASRLRVLDPQDYGTGENLQYWLYNAEQVEDMFQVRGWIVHTGEPIETYDIVVVLHDLGKDVYYQCPTQREERTDVTEYMNDGINYDDSGFISNTLVKKLNLQTTRYEVCIAYRNNGERELVKTGTYVGNTDNGQ